MEVAVHIARQAVVLLVVLAAPIPGSGQRVVIKGASPRDVTLAITKRLTAQGFIVIESTDNPAIFILDTRRSKTVYVGNLAYNMPIAVELSVKFKQKDDGLEVKAIEEFLLGRGSPIERREAINSYAERQVIQRLLDDVKKELEEREEPRTAGP
jgi:hypothetical protein